MPCITSKGQQRGQPQQRQASSTGEEAAQFVSIFAKPIEGAVSPPPDISVPATDEPRGVGKVVWYQENLAIVVGVSSDAPLGTKLTFVSGGTGALLWHRSDNLALALVLGGAQSIHVGDGVECKIKGVLQVIDDNGPVIRKDYELVQAPVGNSMFGRASNFFGVDMLAPPPAAAPAAASSGSSGSSAAAARRPPSGFEKARPLLQQQVAIASRDQISESLLTGVKGVDVLTPLGRGASLLVIGPNGTGKTTLAMDAVMGQKASGVRCVYAALHQTEAQLRELLGELELQGSLANTAVVATRPGASLGEQYAAMCTACAIGERVRDEGGHSLVVLDTLKPLVDVWETLLGGLSSLGADEARRGLIKDSNGRDVIMPEPQEEEQLVDYEGMLVSGAVAQRRGFFSTLFMRAAKMNKTSGGGSMSLLPLVPGRPATGVSMAVDVSKYTTISDEQRRKIQAVMRAKLEAELKRPVPAGEVKTDHVEEFISIADGQIVLNESPASASHPYSFNPKLSITRVGTRAYYKALEQLAPQIRLDLSQADDARKFGVSGSTDPVINRYEDYSRRLQAALVQRRGRPVPLEDLVVMLLAIQRGHTDAVSASEVTSFLESAVQHVRNHAAAALDEIASTKLLTAAAEQSILGALSALRPDAAPPAPAV